LLRHWMNQLVDGSIGGQEKIYTKACNAFLPVSSYMWTI
jgi:hypothetical protein